jgi:hypothetical protein
MGNVIMQSVVKLIVMASKCALKGWFSLANTAEAVTLLTNVKTSLFLFVVEMSKEPIQVKPLKVSF